jgi:chromosome segregation ATPase
MEAADVLYGVTMEEMGVSKIISVDLRKASEMTEGGGRVKASVGA